MLCAKNNKVFAFKRFNGTEEVFVLLNLSDKAQEIILPEGLSGAYTEYFKGKLELLNAGEKATLEAWEYKVLLSK